MAWLLSHSRWHGSRARLIFPMITEKRRTGDVGEEIAREYLISKGYKIADKNFQTRFGEIDIIAKKKGALFLLR